MKFNVLSYFFSTMNNIIDTISICEHNDKIYLTCTTPISPVSSSISNTSIKVLFTMKHPSAVNIYKYCDQIMRYTIMKTDYIVTMIKSIAALIDRKVLDFSLVIYMIVAIPTIKSDKIAKVKYLFMRIENGEYRIIDNQHKTYYHFDTIHKFLESHQLTLPVYIPYYVRHNNYATLVDVQTHNIIEDNIEYNIESKKHKLLVFIEDMITKVTCTSDCTQYS